MSAPSSIPTGSQQAAIHYPPAVPAQSGPILVAVDGTKAGESAFLAASTIALKLDLPVHVARVVEPLPILLPDHDKMLQPLVVSPELLRLTREAVTKQLQDIAPKNLKWTVDVEYGRPSAQIVNKASDCNSRMIVMGLVHHGIVDRFLDGDTALEILRQTQTPVLLASADWKSAPKKVVIATDFSASSMRAAQNALSILDTHATVYLVHVCPSATVFDGSGMWEDEYEDAAFEELLRFEKVLSAPPGMKIEHVTIRGHAAAGILRLAASNHAELIVSGTRGTGLLKRLFVGSVASRLVHHSTCSVLIVPDQED
jgi:nucleotide-binding universal stress UspA family protein